MPRSDRSAERRAQHLPVIAEVFAELGYRRTTTAELARRCGVQETTLYRLWNGKKAMFLAAIDHVFSASMAIWQTQAVAGDGTSSAEKVLAYEAEHLGEFGLYRILFAAIGESDDDDIRAAVSTSYHRFHRWIERQIIDHRRRRPEDAAVEIDPALAAWAAVGVGTIINIARDLDLSSGDERARLLSEIGGLLLQGKTP
ncbi:MAG: TetR/AcrR family transcriptional regulator [Thermoanaerobaculales bacterium]|jgi:AcrR family transcriptional regulator|nr:TetR/AcrR family transcriptional regulator [Thermoanaerobaculales bacterium]